MGGDDCDWRPPADQRPATGLTEVQTTQSTHTQEEEQEQHYGSHNNPWSVNSIYDFSYFCCPECENSKYELKQDFVNHALSAHPNSIDPIHHEIIDGSLNDVVLPDATSPIIDFKV